MGVVFIFLFIQGITGEMFLYQPQNIVSKDVNGTAVITCVPSEIFIGLKFSWYHRKWRSSEAPVRVKSCTRDNDKHKFVCKDEKYTASLEIYNVQTNDNGVFYCVYYSSYFLLKFGNGTNLNVGDRSTSKSSVHILGQLHLWHPHNSLNLACVVLAAHNTVLVYWNISGTYHKGQIISREEPDGTWTVMNFISLPKDNWSEEEKVTCEVWLQSSAINVHWKIPGRGEPHGFVSTTCESFLIPMVISGALLALMLSVHFIKTLKIPGNKTQSSMSKNTGIEDEIVYSELNMNHFIGF
ncbi:uncharacterized protein [Ranitomeya imitator]|uniref:uncharacterized protein n=1 Tax=Ranitomeya imitator TaxID=111125 RepID=UPI0037E7EBF9